MNRFLSALALLVLVLALAAPALAGQVNPRKIKKWPELDKVWARSFDAWATDEELDVFVKLKSTDERKEFLKKIGFWKKWKKIDEEMMPNIMAGEVVRGMNKDEVFMCWDKPVKIRKDFRRNAYVDVLNYRFEIDRKGREFLSPKDSKTAYKNELITRFVYMYNGKVFSIVYEGEEEDVMDELPIKDAQGPAAQPEASPEEAQAPSGEEPGKDQAGSEDKSGN
ncbi:MAG: hypothetical protein CMP23_00130 [Rickettsiales bacterium]|nr:hypothetical protein [Rickettsiales bacterium]|tara:strand:- start:3706 stop:4374 length:669 start_codon:yes stop_codon:yes gene_type:complete